MRDMTTTTTTTLKILFFVSKDDIERFLYADALLTCQVYCRRHNFPVNYKSIAGMESIQSTTTYARVD